MELDLNKGLDIRITGEVAKNNTLPVDYLIEISKNLQELVLNLATYDNEGAESIVKDNFKLEFSAFVVGHSVIPEYTFAPVVQTNMHADISNQRNNINNKFEKLIQLSDTNNYADLNKIYPNPIIRNYIVNSLFNFIGSFKNIPVDIVTKNGDNTYKTLYKINKFNTDTKKRLLTEIIEPEDIKEYDGVGLVHVSTKKGKEKRTVKDVFSPDMSLAYYTKFIEFMGTLYKFKYPLYSYFSKEDVYYIIINEQLDITATGKDEMEAKVNFAEEFDHIYKRYNELTNEQLSPRILAIKNAINDLVIRIDK